MPDTTQFPTVRRFGAFEINLQSGELRKNGMRLRLSGQPFQVLAVLVERSGEVVTREELHSKLWGADTFVDFDHGLNSAVARIREVLGDSADNPRFVETLSRRGYRFILPVDVGTSPLAAKTGGGSPETSVDDRNVVAALGPASPPNLDTPAISRGAVPAVMEYPRAVLQRRWKVWAVASLAVIAAGLAMAGLFLRRNPQPQAELTQRRLTFNSSENPVIHQDISPDGKYLAYSDSAGIHVKLLSTGEDRLIPRPAGVSKSAWWRNESWFPDSIQLLTQAYESGAHDSMWTVSLLGQSARELRQSAVGREVSPDGTRVAFLPEPGVSGHFEEIWVMDSQGDNAKKVLAFGESEEFDDVHWSPDGQRLAYMREQHTPAGNLTSLETCDLKGANRTTVLRDTAVWDYSWLRDGRIVFSRPESPGSNEANLWQIGIDPHLGTPIGKPKRITRWPGFLAGQLSASVDGKRLTAIQLTYQGQVYLSELAAGGPRMSPPRRLTNDEANNVPTAWTADSGAVLFGSNRNGAWAIFKQEIDQENPEALVAGREGSPAPHWPRLSADGSWILYVELPASESPPFRMMRIPASGGVPQPVLETSTDSNYECVRGTGGLCVVFEENQDQHQLTLTAFDPLKGRGKVLRTLQKAPGTDFVWGVSPDGTTLAISEASHQPEIHIRLLSLSGGADREIIVRGSPMLESLDWSPDGKGFYCGSASSQASTLLYVDLKGNAHVLWQFKGAGRIWGFPSPDGHHLAIMVSVTNSNVWMLEGF